MIDAHIEIMKLAIGYTCVGVFIATSIAVILDLFNQIDLDDDIKKNLQVVLLIEVVTISVGVFSGFLSVNPKPVITKVEQTQARLQETKQLLTPRIFIHIADESQRSKMSELQLMLKASGFTAPGIENVSGRADIPKNPNVRFFNDEDAENANTIAEQLKSLGFTTAYAYRVKGMRARIGTLEIWLSAN